MRSEAYELTAYELTRDSLQVAAYSLQDSLIEITTIVIDRNEQGDTLMQSIVTDRYRASDRSQLRIESSKTRVEHDTVYVMKRDSVLVERNTGTGLANTPERKSRFVATLRWIFWIIVALIVLVLCFKIKVFKV